MALPGCRGERGSREAGKDQPGAIARTAERGPVKMTVAVGKGEITLAERLELTVEVLADERVDVEMPRLSEGATDSALRAYREYPPESVNGKRLRRQEYILDVFLSGEFTIPAMTARFTDRRTGEGPDDGATVTTEEFTVMVKSLREGEVDPASFRDIKGPVALPAGRAWTWWVGGGLAGAAVFITVAARALRRRGRERPEVVVFPHEWALRQLQALIDERLAERKLVREFYFRLSMIVRQYIERRFDLMAPEWTTQEFMMQVQRSSKLPVEYRAVLADLLQGCDLVKFAQYAPQTDEIEATLTAARDFVERSADSESQRATAA